MSDLLRAERAANPARLRRLLKTEDREAAHQAFVRLNDLDIAFSKITSTQPASQHVEPAGVEALFAPLGGMEKALDEIDALHEEAIRIADLPLPQFQTACEALEARRARKNPLRMLAPDPMRLRRARDRFVVREYLLDTATAIALLGKDAVNGRVDPVLGKPLEYRAGAGRDFEILSEFVDNQGKRVSLHVGAAASPTRN